MGPAREGHAGNAQHGRDQDCGHPGFEPTKSLICDRYSEDRNKAAHEFADDAAHPAEIWDVLRFR